MILNLYKPAGMTSHDVINTVRSMTGEKRVGHAGTLDPFAAGVLIVATGREDTKKLRYLTKNTEKEYKATLELGKTSTTGDPEGVITLAAGTTGVIFSKRGVVTETLREFVGEIEQTPPPYSAIKIHGVPAYKLARKGKEIHLQPRKVRIYAMRLVTYAPPLLAISVTCSAGTYIRSLAKDIGEKLGTGAYLVQLTRTRIGTFTIQNSLSLEQLKIKLKTKSDLGVENLAKPRKYKRLPF